MALDLDKLCVTLDAAAEVVHKYKVEFTLNTDRIASLTPPPVPLHWNSIKFDDPSEIHNIPNDRRGIYAFVVAAGDQPSPTHGYIMYIGIAGVKGNRSLRERYRDYLSTTKVLNRPKLMRMFATWHDVLRFFFAPVDSGVTPADLKSLEKTLNTAWMPPCVEQDIDATTRKMRRAFSD